MGFFEKILFDILKEKEERFINKSKTNNKKR